MGNPDRTPKVQCARGPSPLPAGHMRGVGEAGRASVRPAARGNFAQTPGRDMNHGSPPHSGLPPIDTGTAPLPTGRKTKTEYSPAASDRAGTLCAPFPASMTRRQ